MINKLRKMHKFNSRQLSVIQEGLEKGWMYQFMRNQSLIFYR